MPLPSANFAYMQPLQQVIIDKDSGELLSAGSITFYSDVNRSVLKPIYQQVQLPNNEYSFVELVNPVTLNAIGALSDDNGNDIQIYFYPYEGLPTDEVRGAIELYYIEVYSSGGVLQFTREAQPPGISSGTNPQDTFEATDNIISNPQFVEVLFAPTSGHTYTVSGSNVVTPIAPDWEVETSGTGTFTVEQEELSVLNAPGEPPYSLTISSAGIDSIFLRQRIYQSPRLLGSSYVSASLAAASNSVTSIIMNYVASDGYTAEIMNKETTSDGNFTTLINDEASLLDSTNTNTPDAPGYIDIEIVIEAEVSVKITSVQVIGVQNAESNTPFLQESTARQIDHLFHDYKPQLIYKPIPSYLVGWDFPLNPSQRGATVAAPALGGVNRAQYCWDQTILFQSVDSSLAVARGAASELQITATLASKGAIIQYLEAPLANKILNSPLAVNVSAKTNATAGLVATVSLYYTADATLPVLTAGTCQSLVATLDANGKPSGLTGTWVEVPRTQGNAQITIESNATTEFNDYSLTGWDASGVAGVNSATFFAIVVGFAELSITKTLNINSISLCAGDIATRPAPKPYDQVLRECEFYYEQTYEAGIAPGTNTASNLRFVVMQAQDEGGSNNVYAYSTPFTLEFSSIKRAAPTVTFYTQAGVSGSVTAFLYYALTGTLVFTTASAACVVTTFWTVNATTGRKALFYAPKVITPLTSVANGSSTNTFASAGITMHYTLDARLGLI